MAEARPDRSKGFPFERTNMVAGYSAGTPWQEEIVDPCLCSVSIEFAFYAFGRWSMALSDSNDLEVQASTTPPMSFSSPIEREKPPQREGDQYQAVYCTVDNRIDISANGRVVTQFDKICISISEDIYPGDDDAQGFMIIIDTFITQNWSIVKKSFFRKPGTAVYADMQLAIQFFIKYPDQPLEPIEIDRILRECSSEGAQPKVNYRVTGKRRIPRHTLANADSKALLIFTYHPGTDC